MVREKVLIKGLEISFKIERKGSQKNFLILHGWGSKAQQWDKVSEIIAGEGFNVIVPDLPGFGESREPERPWNLDDYCVFVQEFAKQLGLKNIYLLGHSFGGSLAVKFALKYPDQVEKLFLVGAACIRRKTLGKSLSKKVAKIFRIFAFLPFYSSVRKGVYRYVFKSDYINSEGVMRKSYLKIISEDLTDALRAIKIPTVIIWGQNDNVTPIEDAYLIEKNVPGSKLAVIPGGNHDLERGNPEILGRKIVENIK